MRRATAGVLLAAGCTLGAASCAPTIIPSLRPQLPEYRLAILVRSVGGRCRTTTIPALVVATSRQTLTWEVMSLDPAACKPGDVTLAAKTRVASAAATATAAPAETAADDKGRTFNPIKGERADTWMARNLAPGRYKYDVRIGSETEDPELEIWP